MKDQHAKLEVGELRFRSEEVEVLRPSKIYGPDGRSRWCQRIAYVDEEIVDFSIGLQVLRGQRGWLDVARACTSHQNYHIHRWTTLPGSERVRSQWLIDTLEDAEKAYYHAMGLFEFQAKEIRRWERR